MKIMKSIWELQKLWNQRNPWDNKSNIENHINPYENKETHENHRNP